MPTRAIRQERKANNNARKLYRTIHKDIIQWKGCESIVVDSKKTHMRMRARNKEEKEKEKMMKKMGAAKQLTARAVKQLPARAAKQLTARAVKQLTAMVMQQLTARAAKQLMARKIGKCTAGEQTQTARH